ncbi:MAG: cob(I)yrinic acid a,c-diamide adenosyltransferase [Candidatus Sungbacteria bacterium]|uniref:Cob(I)yrinic acid a,c-diamide adenosyltransferase n=1 Tax=Candidatus Sungiibacteriota bacterium TaxID=2750080 RepID=A0A932YV95_9BACT|nr:cob(I)yrinic acid a,c-diamide adenosyltransferase [Candidatus Sungbacteria bacterium]
MLLVFTGNGKGKTTAALGQALRSVGEGKRVLMVQFIKGPWKSGEDDSAKLLATNFKLVKMGKGFVGILGDSLPFEEHQKAAEEGLALAKHEMGSGNWDMVILDEVSNAVHLNLIPKEKVIELFDFIKRAPASDSSSAAIHRLEYLILTGRDAPQEFIDAADLVTEMQDVKHPFEKGVKARRGLEY